MSSPNVLVAHIPEKVNKEYHDGDWWDIHIDDMLASEVEMGQFLSGLIRYLKPAITVETGCASAYTTTAMASAHAENLKGKVVSCDIDAEKVQKAQRLLGLMPVEIRACSSLGLPELGSADLVFSDSDFATRVQEFEKVKAGCVFVVHDTAQIPELADFVLKNGGINFNKGRGFGIIQKR